MLIKRKTGNISKTTLKGNLEITGDASVLINGNLVSDGDFELDLGSDLEVITITASSLSTASIKLTDLEYIIDYKHLDQSIILIKI